MRWNYLCPGSVSIPVLFMLTRNSITIYIYFITWLSWIIGVVVIALERQSQGFLRFSIGLMVDMASKNISSCTVSYTALPMKTDFHFQPTLS